MATFPGWLGWLLLLAVAVTLAIMWTVLQRVGQMRRALVTDGSREPRSRQELEEWYTAGLVDREGYERLKNRLM